ncbi:MAG: aminoacyl-tRNA hydrolase [Rickettsiales bacterium]|nr:aminoacyl-tRNA hydrolase [Rickettsiales bacterium]
MKLIVALGNIGKEYESTRHNFGFLLLDQIVRDYSLQNGGIKNKAEIFAGNIGEQKVVAIKPQTYMNLSGQAVSPIVSFYKISLDDVLVLHDEIDIDLGDVRFKQGGGHAGHNGLKSLDSSIGKNYKRLRLGVGRPSDSRFEVSDYVLGKFSKDEMVVAEEIMAEYSKRIGEFL